MARSIEIKGSRMSGQVVNSNISYRTQVAATTIYTARYIWHLQLILVQYILLHSSSFNPYLPRDKMGASLSNTLTQIFPPKPKFTEKNLPNLQGKVSNLTSR